MFCLYQSGRKFTDFFWENAWILLTLFQIFEAMPRFDLDVTKRYTYADYLTWRFEETLELLRGKIAKMSPAPRSVHQLISMNLSGEIHGYLRKKKCKVFTAPFDVRLPLSPEKSTDDQIDTVVQPDICVICDLSKIDEKGCKGAPDMIIEILSPATAHKDINEKYKIYEEAGVWEYWIVAPNEQTISVFFLKNGKYELVKIYTRQEVIKVNIFEDLHIDLRDIFEDLEDY